MNLKEAIDNYTPAAPKIQNYETTAFDGVVFRNTYIVCPKCGVRVDTFFRPNYCGQCGKRILWEDYHETRKI